MAKKETEAPPAPPMLFGPAPDPVRALTDALYVVLLLVMIGTMGVHLVRLLREP